MIDKRRYLDDRIDPVAQLQLLAEQDVGAEAFPVGLGGDNLAVIGGAPKKIPALTPSPGWKMLFANIQLHFTPK